jgi:hypothetical protein
MALLLRYSNSEIVLFEASKNVIFSKVESLSMGMV